MSRAVISKLLMSTMLVLLMRSSVISARATRQGDLTEMLPKMLNAVEHGLSFFAQDYSSINVDGLFGIRMGQGQISEAVTECQRSSSCPESVRGRLQVLADNIDVTARAAMGYVQAEDPEYFDRFLGTVDAAYRTEYKAKLMKDLEQTPVGRLDGYNEEQGDRCFARIMGTYEEDGKKVKECNVTNLCWDMMTASNRSRYAITHQLLYFIIIEKQGCLQVVESAVGVNIAETMERFCGSIYNEAVEEGVNGSVTEMHQDLFLEQVLLCGSLGYENFLRSDWMRMVLSWQKPTGCFSLNSPRLLAMEEKVTFFMQEERKLLKDLKWEAEMIEKQHQGRKLLREQIMNDGCLAHKSGLGFGTLCLFTRYLVRQNFLIQ